MRALRLLPLTVLLVACGGGTDDDDDAPTVTCGDAPPTFTAATVTDMGDRELGGETRRALQITAAVDDADGDLFRYRALVWYDTRTDSTEWAERPDVFVDVDIADPTASEETGLGGPCRFKKVTAGAILAVGDDDVPPGEPVRFGLVIEDAAGNASNDGVPVAVVFTTPEVE